MTTNDDWHQRWREGRIGFHLPHVNPDLLRFAGDLPPPPARVLVPLCGKSVDMTFLAERGHHVIGIELVEEAARAYFAERGEEPAADASGPHLVLRAGRVEIHVADVLAMPLRALGAVDAVWDRAALIALPPEARRPYAARMSEVLGVGGRMLLATLAYDQDLMDGPPYSVDDDEVRALYGTLSLARLDHRAEEQPPQRLQDVGGSASTSVWSASR